MEGGNKDLVPHKKENESLRKEKDKLVQINLSVMKWYGAWSLDQKQYLPDSAVIPLVKYEKGKHWPEPANGAPELISVQKLRGDSLFAPVKTEVSDVSYESEFIDIPWSFVKEGSYIVLLVPLVGPDGIIAYDTTVLKCLSDQKLLKLTGGMEFHAKKELNKFNKEQLPLPNAPGGDFSVNLSNMFCDLVDLVKNDQSDTVNIWMGFSEFSENLQKRAVNGTICYRMVEGKAERKKSKEPERVLKLVPQKIGAI